MILRAPGQTDRAALFQAFGRLVESLDGRYITAEDVGTTVEDMRAAQAETRYISGLPRAGGFGGNPRQDRLWRVRRHRSRGAGRAGRTGLDGVSVAVQGLGSVGWELCRLLHEAGARLIVADVDAKVAQAAERFGARTVAPDNIVRRRRRVRAVRTGAVITPAVAAGCAFQVGGGRANNQLASLAEGDVLQRRGIFYAPDFLINAGGIISCAREFLAAPTRPR